MSAGEQSPEKAQVHCRHCGQPITHHESTGGWQWRDNSPHSPSACFKSRSLAHEPVLWVGAHPPYFVNYIDPKVCGGRVDRWFVMGTVAGDPRDQQGPVAICEYEPSAHAIAYLLNATVDGHVVVHPTAWDEPKGMDCSCGGQCPDCNPPQTVIEPGCESCEGRGCPDCLRLVCPFCQTALSGPPPLTGCMRPQDHNGATGGGFGA